MAEEHHTPLRMRILVGLFCLLVFTPPVATLLTPTESVGMDENRTLASAPGVPHSLAEINAFPKAFDTWYADHFGLRNTFIRFYSYVRFSLLRLPSDSRVLVGTDGWLFYAEDDVVRDQRGLNPWTGLELSIWRDELAKRRDWLHRRGIHYLFVSVPDKQSVYSEHLPEHPADASFPPPGQGHRPRRMVQLTTYLANTPDGSHLPLLNLDEALARSKTAFPAPLYERTGTHWTDVGAYVGYREILLRLQSDFPRIAPHPFTDFDLAWSEEKAFELVDMGGLKGRFAEREPRLSPHGGHCAVPIPFPTVLPEEWNKPGRPPLATECPIAPPLRVLVLRDSFGTRLMPFLSENFRQAAYVWSRFDPELVDQMIAAFHPDLIIEESVERRMAVQHRVPGT
ncbi:MAG: hypothetical protein OEW11_00195 [Nitrospirota bacterium]|nr:hypothetical protein [Nitrospirota bacterium]